MPDAAAMLGLPNGMATFTVTPAGGDTVTKPGARRAVVGPPINGGPSNASMWILQVPSTDAGQTANSYRWQGDVPWNTSAPTSYVYFGNTFASLGGL